MIDFSKYPLPERLRHHTSPNFYIPAKELKIIPKGYPPIIKSIKWAEHFENNLPPDALDIGCGKGKFLLEMSLLYPNRNFLGIEVRPLPVEWLQTVIKGEKLKNVSVIRYSVVNGLTFIENESVSEVFYLFPDPWPKKKHFKRRAFNLDFLAEIYRTLKTNGKLLLATDVLQVQQYHLETLEQFGKFNVNIVENDDQWKYPITNKESFCRRIGIPFHRIICTK